MAWPRHVNNGVLNNLRVIYDFCQHKTYKTSLAVKHYAVSVNDNVHFQVSDKDKAVSMIMLQRNVTDM